MAFACIYVPDFMVQSVVRAEPVLRDGAIALRESALALRDSALVLISGSPPLWNVVAANSAALQAGIHLGMTKSQVAEFCAVQIRHRCEAQEKAAHAALLDVGWSVSPRVEDTAADTIVRVGVIPHIAVASNMEVAILAARGFAGISIISAGEEPQRLGGLPIQVLLTGTEVLEILERWGVSTLRELAALPVLQLSERLGQEGVRLHELARGAYVRSLVLAQPNLSFEEEMELEDARALAVRAVRVRFELEPSFEKDVQALKDDSRKKTAAKEYAKVLTLPVAMRDSKLLLKLLRLLLQSDPPKAPIQKIVLAADAAPPRVAQNGLFAPCGPDPEKLELTIARLAKLVGESNVGSPELLDTHRAENFRMRRWAAIGSVAEGASPSPTSSTRAKNRKPQNRKATNCKRSGALLDEGESREARKTMTGFRAIRPPLAVSVEVREERPVRVCFRGMQGDVVAASGPWRSSGDWWQEDGWDQDEWDLAIDFGSSLGQREQSLNAWPQRGVYRIYYDAPRRDWFVRGFYD